MISRLDAPEAQAAIPALAEILIACVRSGAEVSFMQDITEEQARAFWQGVAANVQAGHVMLFVARDAAGKLQGTVQLEPIRKPNQPHRAEVAKLLVHPRARRQGLGEALMRHLEQEARAIGRSLITLDTASGSFGHVLYRKLGYVEFGRIPDYALTPDGRLSEAAFLYKQLG